jgi:hypothetical protein
MQCENMIYLVQHTGGGVSRNRCATASSSSSTKRRRRWGSSGHSAPTILPTAAEKLRDGKGGVGSAREGLWQRGDGGERS